MQPLVEELEVTEYGIGWHVNWSAVWIGALAAIAAALIFGLIGTALGATAVHVISSWKTVPFAQVATIVCAGFFSMVIGGWAAAKVTALGHAEPAILHAVAAWLVAIPLLLLLLAAGAGTAFGGGYGGLVSSPLVAAVPATPDVVRLDRRGARRLERQRRAHDADASSHPPPALRRFEGKYVMILILFWLLGAPLGLLIILYLLGVGH
jgi:hypothetical protein